MVVRRNVSSIETERPRQTKRDRGYRCVLYMVR